MKIDDLSQPRIGDIVEFETDPDTVVEGLIVGETADGYVYEFSVAGYTELNHIPESSGYIPKNAKEAKDPRWSAALSVDVHTDTMKKQISAFFPSNPQPDGLKQVTEAEYHGRHVVLNRPLPGDVKKFKVYVKDPKSGKIKKVNFGDPNMRIHKSNPKRRKSFRARHRCDTNPGPKTKARYWSCRKW